MEQGVEHALPVFHRPGSHVICWATEIMSRLLLLQLGRLFAGLGTVYAAAPGCPFIGPLALGPGSAAYVSSCIAWSSGSLWSAHTPHCCWAGLATWWWLCSRKPFAPLAACSIAACPLHRGALQSKALVPRDISLDRQSKPAPWSGAHRRPSCGVLTNAGVCLGTRPSCRAEGLRWTIWRLAECAAGR